MGARDRSRQAETTDRRSPARASRQYQLRAARHVPTGHHLPQGTERHHPGTGDLLLEHQKEKLSAERGEREGTLHKGVQSRDSMWAYTFRRILATIPVLTIVALVVFSILH